MKYLLACKKYYSYKKYVFVGRIFFGRKDHGCITIWEPLSFTMIADNFMQVQVPDGYHAGTIAISTILNIILGMLWYGPLFGKS